MISRRLLSQTLALLISLAMLTAPLVAQQRPAPAKPRAAAPAKAAAKPEHPEIQIDSLLAADSYKIYGELKNVGTLVHSGAFAELIDPVMKLADPPKEFKTLVKFINSNAETLANSRLVFATWPARAEIPNAFFVIEMATAEDAAQFEPKLNRVLPIILPTPTPTPTQTPGPIDEKGVTLVSPSAGPGAGTSTQLQAKGEAHAPGETPPPPKPQFVVSHSGNLVFITDRAFKFDKLRPADTKLLTEDQNFRQAHERFSTEPVFIFINVALSDSNRTKALQEAAEAQEQARIKDEAKVEVEPPPDPESPPAPDAEDTPEPPMTEMRTTVTVQDQPPGVLSAGDPKSTPPQPRPQMAAIGSLMNLLGGANPSGPTQSASRSLRKGTITLSAQSWLGHRMGSGWYCHSYPSCLRAGA